MGTANPASATPAGTVNTTSASPTPLGAANVASTASGSTNPEQLFAAGYSACFLSALELVAKRDRDANRDKNAPAVFPAHPTVTAIVGIGPRGEGFALEVELKIALPGVNKDQAEKWIEAAHQVCPYSNATRGNINVILTLSPNA
jgi:Ohr subfamily peroxiredoxin